MKTSCLLPFALLCALILPNAASAVSTTVQDDALLLSGDPVLVDASLDTMQSIGFTHVRLTANWAQIAPASDTDSKPAFDATDPNAYPADAWKLLDLAVRETRAHGMEPMIDIGFWAPYWATTEALGSSGVRARENVDPAAYADFAEAVARRYSGAFTPPTPPAPAPAAEPEPAPSPFAPLFGSPKPEPKPEPAPAPKSDPLPVVNVYTLWNEPNIKGFLMPQWKQTKQGRKPASPGIYRRMLTASYPRVKAVNPRSTVLIGATSSTGSYAVSGLHGGVPPLRFIRALACVDDRLRPIRTGDCKNFTRLPGDGWSHHPYSFDYEASHRSDRRRPDDAILGDTMRLRQLLKRLANAKRISRASTYLYLTEYGYFTTPIGTHRAVTEPEQGRLLVSAHAFASTAPGVRMMSQFLLRDVQCTGDATTSCLNWSTGLQRADGTPKPGLDRLRQQLTKP